MTKPRTRTCDLCKSKDDELKTVDEAREAGWLWVTTPMSTFRVCPQCSRWIALELGEAGYVMPGPKYQQLREKTA